MKSNQIDFCKDIVTATVADELSHLDKKPATAALQEFMRTKTYELLLDSDSMLFLESPTYILDMVAAERNNDWEDWLEV